MNHLQGKTIIITGASKGIGRALALALANHEVKLVVTARSAPELQSLQREAETGGSRCLAIPADVGSEADTQLVATETIRAFGSIDFLINNAGYGIFKPIHETSAEEWDAVFATNTRGSFLCTKAVQPTMMAQGSGHIINVASDVARRTFAGGALYCSSKYAQDAFSLALRKEMRPHGVKVGVVYSGLVDSQFHAGPQGDAAHAQWLKVEDMARAIVFMMNQPPHVVIDELVIHPLAQEY